MRRVSHVVADHTSMLAFMEKRFLRDATGAQPHLTLRDLHASTLEDLFDFDAAPSMALRFPPRRSRYPTTPDARSFRRGRSRT